MYKKIEQLCKQNNVTPYQVAKATGIRISSFTDWKSGKFKPSLKSLMKLAKYFDVSLLDLVDDD